MAEVAGVSGRGVVETDLGATGGASGAESPPLSLMPDPAAELAASGDPHAVLAALMISVNQERKESARELKRTSFAAADQAARERIDHLRDKADCELVGAIVENGVKCGAGVFEAHVATRSGVSDAQLGAASATNQSLTAGGAIGGGLFKHAASRDDAAASAADLARETNKRAADEFSDVEKDANDAVRRAFDHYKDLSQAKQDAQKAALHRA